MFDIVRMNKLMQLAGIILTLHTVLYAQDASQAGNTTMTKNQNGLFLPGAEPALISSQFAFTEGPAVDASGNIYFTDQPHDRIWKYDTDGNISLYMENTRRSNGLYFDRNGNLVACADEKNQLIRISLDKTITVLVDNVNGARLNGPNDVWIHPHGDIYFTDPLYERPYWNDTVVRAQKENVFVLRRGKSQPEVVDSEVAKPNGIVGTPDGKYLYVADIGAGKTYRYTIRRNGKLQKKTLFVNQGSDGMTIDNGGNIYLTGKGVTVYSPSGEEIAWIDVPADWTANVCFGGSDMNKLFITATHSVFVMEMLVNGAQ